MRVRVSRRFALAMLGLCLTPGPAVGSPAESEGGLGLARPTQYVTDETGWLRERDKNALNERFAAFEHETSNQVVFYVARRQPAGLSAERAALQALYEWRVGQAAGSNGVVLLVFLGDRTMGLAVGSGLDAAFSRESRLRILHEALRPQVQAGNVTAGLNAAAALILAGARQAGHRGKEPPAARVEAPLPTPVPPAAATPAPGPVTRTLAVASRFGPGTTFLLLLALGTVALTVKLNPFGKRGVGFFVLSGLANTGLLVHASLGDRTELVAGSIVAFLAMIVIASYRTKSQIAAIREAEHAAWVEHKGDQEWSRDHRDRL